MRYEQRPKKLPPVEESGIQALTAKSLRSLATHFGVNYETVRAILRGTTSNGPAVGHPIWTCQSSP